MKTETVQRDDHQVQLIAEVEPEMLERYKLSAARKISSNAKIPGFRPGKAPYDVVRRLYGDQAIQEEAITLMLDEVYPAAVSEAKLNPGGIGRLEEIVQVDPPKFSFIVPLAPEVDLGDYKAIRSEYNPPVIGDEKVDEVLLRLQRRSAVSKLVERPAAAGDMVKLTLSGRLLNPDEGSEAELIPETQRQMVAGDASDFTDADGREWPYPGFADAIVGASAGEEKVFSYTFPDDGSNDDLSGKEAEFTVKIESVNELELHPLDDEFAQSLGQYESMEKLREQISNDLKQEASNRYNRDYIEGVIGKLLENTTVKYAPTMLEEEVEHALGHFEERLAQQRLDLETYLKTRDLTREAFIEKEVRPAALETLKRNLALEEFARLENIQLSSEEVQMIYNMAQNQARQDPSLKALAKGKTSKKDVGESLARRTLNEIFNARMTGRLRAIATGTADAPEVLEAAETAETSETAAEAMTAEVTTAEAVTVETKTPKAKKAKAKKAAAVEPANGSPADAEAPASQDPAETAPTVE